MSSSKHLELKGTHALLSPSSYSWINYTEDEQLISRLKSSYAQAIGTATHELAADLITNRIRLNKSSRSILQLHLTKAKIPDAVVDYDDIYPNLVNYVNDSISMRMFAEEVLYYSDLCYGTVDAYCFRKGHLRIHDLKTGKLQAKMDQLEIYAALFCLQNDIKPEAIDIDLRIYQFGDVTVYNPKGEDIRIIMDGIVAKDKFLSNYISRGGSDD